MARLLCQLSLALFGGISLLPLAAEARSRGILAKSCSGCHGGEDAAVVELVAESPLALGQEAIFVLTVSFSGANGVGAHVTTDGVGELRALENEGLVSVAGSLTHSQPKPTQGGTATFRFAWTPPPEPGGVGFEVAVLAANMNQTSNGDTPGVGFFSWAYGCEGQRYYYDGDGDGYGSSTFGTMMGCQGAPPDRFAALDGDCNDNRPEVNPGAPELCNQYDDDCDEEIDEDAIPVELWPDTDGDGYYRDQEGEPLIGCVGIDGYAARFGDCDPDDPAINPDAEEICNFIDDNCDGRADERVRPQCGVGRCTRESFSCDAADCTPGSPRPEECNLLDDDCDGETDEGALCEPGFLCITGVCLSETNVADPQAGGSSSGGTSSAGTSNGGDSTTVGGSSTKETKETAGTGCSVNSRSVPGWLGLFLGLVLVGGARRRALLGRVHLTRA